MNKIIDGCIWDSEIDKWVPEEDYKDKLTVFCDRDNISTKGTHKVDVLMGPTYNQLWNFLGDPTYDTTACATTRQWRSLARPHPY